MMRERMSPPGAAAHRARRSLLAAAALSTLLAALPAGAFDLTRAAVERLDNGLTLIVLEEPALPVASVQMLYKVGARDEPLGASGIAHFLEHMAFRDSESFPDTEVVSSIYAVGGEWHGYTWLDQTTYFATVPAEHLDLLLRIEADRMARLVIETGDVEPERGAVLAEMHGYENDPATVLKDAVLAASFTQHPYRNNTIGWESDVADITHDELVDFYRRYYRPANAVLAVAGRVSRPAVAARVRELFGGLPEGPAPPPPPTVEPPQRGVRRVELPGAGGRSRFEVAYRAPAAGDPELAAFLVLQDVLAGGRGVNFAQNTFGDAARPGSPLAAVAEDLVTWYPPQAAPYVFTVAGSIAPDESPADLEVRLEAAIAPLRDAGPTADEVRAARRRLADELVFDVETTEDAAHQLAYFAGLDALDALFALPAAIAAVTPDDVRRAARRHLQPYQRTIGWILAGPPPAAIEPPPAAIEPPPSAAAPPPAGKAGTAEPAPSRSETPAPPRVIRLSGGLPVLFQRLPLSSSAYLRLLVPATGLELAAPPPGVELTADDPLWRHTSLSIRFRPAEIADAVGQAAAAWHGARPGPAQDPEEVDDPLARLALALDERVGRIGSLAPASRSSSGSPSGSSVGSPSGSSVGSVAVAGAAGEAPAGVTAIALAGDVDEAVALPLLEAAFGDLAPAAVEPLAPPAPRAPPGETRIELAAEKAQAALGYVVAAPPPADPDWMAWRALLYVLSHGYEGRLGKEAISRLGLAYYIDARYLTDGGAGRVSLETGVDPGKLEALRALQRGELERLRAAPPTAAEVAEAGAHLVGRRESAAQSNEEVSAMLLSDWVGHGRLLTPADVEAAAAALSAADVERVLPAFLAGSTVVVGVGAGPRAEEPRPEEPRAEGPGAGDPSAGDPSAGDSSAGEPAAGEPAAGEPSAGDPGAGEPSAGDPSAGEPSVGEPGAGEPGAQATTGEEPRASHIFTGGPILTLDGAAGAEALAIGGGRILAVGSREAAAAFRGPGTVDVDLAGRALAPAFVDHHVHLLNLGLSLLYDEEPSPAFIDLAGMTSIADVGAELAARAAQLAPGSWILGQSWSQGAWGSVSLPEHEPLSAAAPEHPVFLTRVDGHAGWVNAAALRRAGIDAATPDPPGGAIQRRTDGAPRGVLLERANELLRPWLPEPTDGEIRRAFRLAAEALAAQGVVEVFDAGFLGPPGIVDLELDLGRYLELLAAEDRERPLPLRVHLMVPAPSRLADAIAADPDRYRQLTPRVGVTHFKLFADGALGSRGALLSHPYADDPATHGVERMSREELLAATARALDAGFDVATHAIGDAAVASALDAYEETLRQRPGLAPSRLRIEHFSYAAAPDFERAAALGIVVCVNPDFILPADDGATMEDARVGAEDGERVYAFGRLATAGGRLAFGSDYFTRPAQPLIGLYAAATRQNASSLPAAGWHPENRLSRESSLRIMTTLWPADGAGPGGGGLAIGEAADLGVLSADPLTVDAAEILRITATATLLDGALVAGALP